MNRTNDEKASLENAVKLMSSLQSDELELDDLCRILVLDTFKDAEVKIAIVVRLNGNATISAISSFGMDSPKENYQNIPLETNSPNIKAIKENQIIWIPNKEAFDKQFPIVNKEYQKIAFDSIYAVPITKFGSPIGSFSIVGTNLPMNDLIKADLELIALMIATRFSTMGEYIEALPTFPELIPSMVSLSNRERSIQKYMKNGLTNAQIAIELGYSESLIRQAAVILFSKLGVSNRSEAGNLYREEENNV